MSRSNWNRPSAVDLTTAMNRTLAEARARDRRRRRRRGVRPNDAERFNRRLFFERYPETKGISDPLDDAGRGDAAA